MALVDRHRPSLEAAEREFRAASERLEVMGVAADVTSRADVQRAVGDVVRKWQRVDILVAAAGITGKTNVKAADVDPEVRAAPRCMARGGSHAVCHT